MSLAKVFVTAGDLWFESLNELLHKVKTVCNLGRLRCPFRCPLGILLATVPAHIVDFWVLAHPVGCRLGRTFVEQIHHLVLLKIDKNGSERAPTAKREIVDHEARRPSQPQMWEGP